MIILGFDTSGDACSAALWRDGETLARRFERPGRGHAERLFPMIEACLAEAALGWERIDRIGVIAGPGSFTGLRVGVAAARGLALALDRPAIGLDGFEALAAGVASRRAAPRLAVAFGRAPLLLWRLFECGDGVARPLCDRRDGDAAALAADRPTLLAGPAAAALAEIAEAAPEVDAEPATVARLAAEAPASAGRPTPLYSRPPDAAPSRISPPPRR